MWRVLLARWLAMIVRMTGVVSEIGEDRVIVDRDGICYEVLVCGHTISELQELEGQKITLHTMQYLEGSSAGGNLIPRLIGFVHREDRAFFERFIKVKNIGARKALKALALPVSAVAAAIESGNAVTLSKLPGVGKRAAEQIIAELRGKVTDFALGVTEETVKGEDATGEWSAAQLDALEVMVALGERRPDAQRWMERAISRFPGEHGPDEWVRLAYRTRSLEG